MAKSRRKARGTGGGKGGGRKKIDWGGGADKQTGRLNMILIALAAVAIAAGGTYWWQTTRAAATFDELVAQGQAALAEVKSQPNAGAEHLSPGAAHSYGVAFPTSGAHDPVPTDPGFYSTPQRPTQLVHALEHGHVVVYYDEPGEEALALLKDWAGLFGGHWDGVVVTPGSGLGESVVLTAWRKTLRLDNFDAAAAAAFVDAYRGRGPENPVR